MGKFTDGFMDGTNDVVTFATAKKLKEKGYDRPCLLHYDIMGNLQWNNILVDHGFDTVSVAEGLTDYNSFHFTCIDAPATSQVMKWLREEVSVHVETFATSFGYGFIISRTPDKGGTDLYHSRYEGPNDGGAWDRPEDAEAAALDYVIDNLI